MEIQTGDGKNGLESLEVDGMSVISETEHELSEEYFPEADKQQSSCVLATEESEADGQVVPYQSTHLREVFYKEGTHKEECLTVPQIEIDGKPVERLEKQNELAEDYRKEDKYLLKQQDQFAKIIENTKEELCVNKFQWPPLGITDETVKNVTNKPDMFQQFLLGKNDERSASEVSNTCPLVKPATISNMEPINTTVAMKDEDRRPEEPKIQLSSIFKRDTEVARGKETAIHFPEIMSNMEPINTTVAMEDEDLRAEEPKIQLSSIFKRDSEVARGKETAVHFPDGMSNMKPILVNTTLEDEDPAEKPKLSSIFKRDVKAARSKETGVHFPEDMSNIEPILVNTTVALKDEYLPEDPKIQLPSILKEDTKAARGKETTVHFPEDMSNMEHVNTTVALPLEDEDLPEEPKLSSILKRDTKADRCKETAVHFPEDIVSIRFYDISDDDSDTDTVILSDTEENLPTDQQVPSNAFYGSFDNDYCIPNLSYLSYKCGEFKPQFSFPPAIKISNYQLFNSLDDEEQMVEEMEISIDNELDVVGIESQLDEEYEYHDDQSAGTENMAIWKKPVILEFTNFKEQAAVGNVAGVTELTESQEGMHEFYNDQSIIMEKKATQEDPAREFAQLKEEDAVTSTAGVTKSTEYQSEIDEFDKGQSSSIEKLIIREGQAAKFAHCMERIAESHADGISEDNSVLDNCARKCGNMEVDVENCGDDKKILCKDAVQECPSEFNVECGSSLERPWTTNDSKIADAIPHLEKQKDIENQEIKDSRMQSHAIITSVPDQTSFPGGCGSRFLRRRPVSIDTLLINEDLAMSTFKESIRPTKIPQTITEEDMVFYDERIIDIVTHETNILNLSQEKINCVYEKSQCHEKPEKAVISALTSSPDHFNTFDLTWESSVDLNPRNYGREESIVKSTINAETSPEDNQFTALGDLRCDRIRTEEEVDFYEDQKQRVSISGTSSIKPEKHIWAKRPEKCVVPVYETCPDNNPPCPVLMYPMISPEHTQKRSPQIVPEIEARESKISRKHLTTQSNNTSLHAVPSEPDDVMDFDASFHSDDHSFPESKISGGCDTPSKVNENHTNIEERKSVSQNSVFYPTSASHSSETAVFLTRQGRNRLRVGLSKSTRVKPLHPYWSKSRIK